MDYKFLIDRMYVVTLAYATRLMSGATFHPLVLMLLLSGWCFFVFLSRVFTANLSFQYANVID